MASSLRDLFISVFKRGKKKKKKKKTDQKKTSGMLLFAGNQILESVFTLTGRRKRRRGLHTREGSNKRSLVLSRRLRLLPAEKEGGNTIRGIVGRKGKHVN